VLSKGVEPKAENAWQCNLFLPDLLLNALMQLATLKNSNRFDEVFSHGRFAVKDYLVLYVLENGLELSRYGVSISSKAGSAVVRNKIRRWARQILNSLSARIKAGYDFIIVVRKCPSYNYIEFRDKLLYLMDNRGLLAEEEVK